jgi:hypothetical protein
MWCMYCDRSLQTFQRKVFFRGRFLD